MSEADKRKDITVDEYISSLEDAQMQTDARALMDIMRRISGEEPILYGIGTIGYGIYEYEYTSGRKGEAHTLAFYPRKGKITIYLMDGTKRYADQLTKLGKYTATGYCIYVKKLADIDISVLTNILKASYKNIQEKSRSGPIDQILWQS